MSQIIDVDFLILGSGITGLYAALQLADYGETLVITKSKVVESNTNYAQGGVAAVLSPEDSAENHIRDTLDAGAGLCDIEAVETLVREGPEHIRKLSQIGVPFERTQSGELDLVREGGHGMNRIVHASDFTGREIEKTLEEAARKKGIRVHEYCCAVELITRYHLGENDAAQKGAGSNANRCYGAYIYDRKTWEIFIVRARAVLLATGGGAQVYLHNTNPEVATGDGIALSYRAGAVISNMEFFQFHPTSLYSPGEPAFLISEALRGYGAKLRNYDGSDFMHKYDERKELAPRDIVARAIDAELKRTGSRHVWLDITEKSSEELMAKFPNIYAHCLERRINISKQMIPVVPAAHYMCGGVRTDLDGWTGIEGLYVAGETACTGVHGGNRLASNSLLEGLVFGARVASCLSKDASNPRPAFPQVRPWNKEGLKNAEEWILVQHNFDELRRLMWDYVGIVRSDLRLNRALRRIRLLYEEVEDFYRRTEIQNRILELRNLTLTALLMIQSALHRKESRGLHFTTDYPESREPSMDYTNLQRPLEGNISHVQK